MWKNPEAQIPKKVLHTFWIKKRTQQSNYDPTDNKVIPQLVVKNVSMNTIKQFNINYKQKKTTKHQTSKIKTNEIYY